MQILTEQYAQEALSSAYRGFFGIRKKSKEKVAKVLTPQSLCDAYTAGRRTAKGTYYLKDPTYDLQFELLNLEADKDERHWGIHSFNWEQNIVENLELNLRSLKENEFLRISKMALPLSNSYPKDKIERILYENRLPPPDSFERDEIIRAIVEVQVLALVVIANHISTIEQLAVDPISTATQDYKRHPQVQRTSAKLTDDESKHGLTSGKYLTDVLHAELTPSTKHIKEFDRYHYLAKGMPGGAVFLAYIIEIVGNVFFKRLSSQCPEPLLKEICFKISTKDEDVHIEKCRTLYNFVHQEEKQTRLGKKWEEYRNAVALVLITHGVYEEHQDKSNPFYLATTALGISREDLLSDVRIELKTNLDKIGVQISEKLLSSI